MDALFTDFSEYNTNTSTDLGFTSWDNLDFGMEHYNPFPSEDDFLFQASLVDNTVSDINPNEDPLSSKLSAPLQSSSMKLPQSLPELELPTTKKRTFSQFEKSPSSKPSSTNIIPQPQKMIPSSSIEEKSSFNQWHVQALNGKYKNQLASVNIGTSVYIRGEDYTNWIPNRLYTSHKYHLKFSVANLPVHFQNVTAHIKLIQNGSKQEITDRQIIKPTNNTTMAPMLTPTEANIVEGEMRFQLLLSSYKLPKGDKQMQFHVDFVSPTNEVLFSIRSPGFEVFARKNEVEILPARPIQPLAIEPLLEDQRPTQMKFNSNEAMSLILATMDSLSPAERQLALQYVKNSF